MNNKVSLLSIKEYLKRILERNILILIFSSLVFGFLFFTENGIIHQYYLYNSKKNSISKDIKQKQEQLNILNKKLECLKNDNKDLMEEILYQYQNKDPYLNKKKTIVTIK